MRSSIGIDTGLCNFLPTDILHLIYDTFDRFLDPLVATATGFHK